MLILAKPILKEDISISRNKNNKFMYLTKGNVNNGNEKSFYKEEIDYDNKSNNNNQFIIKEATFNINYTMDRNVPQSILYI